LGAGKVLNQGLLDGMSKIGRRFNFKANEVYIPEALIDARAMNQSMEDAHGQGEGRTA